MNKIEIINQKKYIELPCQPGDSVWFVGGRDGNDTDIEQKIFEGKVKSLNVVVNSGNEMNYFAIIEYEYNSDHHIKSEVTRSFYPYANWKLCYTNYEACAHAHGGYLPKRIAKWEPYHSYLTCSECHDVYIEPEWLEDGKWSYCPNCGAKMEGIADERTD